MQIKTNDKAYRHDRELWLDNETKASWLTVIDYRMRIGTAQVSMAGIGGVYTKEEHRKQGYMRTLFEDTVTYMIEQGYDVTQLFGIENFYNKFGYATSLPKSHFTIKTRDAEAAEHTMDEVRSRAFEPDDMPEIIRLYNAHNAMRTGSIVRDPDRTSEFKKGTWYGTPPEVRVWEDARGAVAGYVVWDRSDTEVKVAEVDAWNDDLFPAILYTLAEQAIAKRCETLEVYAPPDHPFAEYAQRYGIEWTVRHPRYSDGMMRILNQKPLFTKLRPELERRVASSPLNGYSGTLAIKTDLGAMPLTFDVGTLTLDADRDADSVLTLSQDKLMQLIVGYRSVRDVLNSSGVEMEGEGGPLLNVLFPKGNPYTWRVDHY